ASVIKKIGTRIFAPRGRRPQTELRRPSPFRDLIMRSTNLGAPGVSLDSPRPQHGMFSPPVRCASADRLGFKRPGALSPTSTTGLADTPAKGGVAQRRSAFA